MARVIWKENSVISIETRKGIFVLAQMLKEPFLMFYQIFSDGDRWENVDLSNTPTLFCKAVAKQFLKQSNIIKQPEISPNLSLKLPKYWIQTNPGNRKVNVWEGTEEEREIITLTETPGGKLIEKDITKGGFQDYPIVMPSISLNDDKTIEAHETTSISLYPELNERLYLCNKLNRNIDPAKNINFDKAIPLDCTKYVDIVSGKIELSKLGY